MSSFNALLAVVLRVHYRLVMTRQGERVSMKDKGFVLQNTGNVRSCERWDLSIPYP